MITHTIGAVLTGGLASRMGAPKASLTYLDTPFIDHVIATLSIVLDEVVVCGGDYSGPLPVLSDPVEGAGPLAGIMAALTHADGRPVMVAPVDMPLITVDLTRRLVDPQVESMGARIARHDDSIQPLCATYGPGLRSLIQDRLARDELAVFGFVDQIEAVEYINADPHTLTNVNTPQDYEDLTGGGTE
ncbi:MAG: molybdenum cofactor guanylyltransferase [Acidimicrobiia bacterium]|nr:molybdenum cofactor guanylyltransferase [Acidimicrobiia bacterium]